MMFRFENLNMPDEKRMERIKQLSPIEAVQAWLDGDFCLDEESALCTAIRKDTRITLSDDEFFDAFVLAIEDECDAQQCLERLASSD